MAPPTVSLQSYNMFQFKPGWELIVIQIIDNINLGPQSRAAPLAPSAVRIYKRKKQGKKGKKAVMKTNAGVVSFSWHISMLDQG